jgi:hypothetical protein
METLCVPLDRYRLGAAADVRRRAWITDVAEGVWRAANDRTAQLRFPAGPDAVELAQARES